MSYSFCIIANPCSGNGRGRRALPSLRKFAADNNGRVLVSRYSGHASALAEQASQQCDLIFAAGGDDTVREVLDGIHAEKNVMGIVPLGTFNNLATSLFLPPDPLECLEQSLHNGFCCKIDLGRIERGLLFTESIGMGIDACAWARAPRKEPKGIWRWIVGLKLGISSLLDFTPQTCSISLDGGPIMKLHDVMQITIANSTFYCAGVQMTPHAKMNDGLLDICIIMRMNKLKFLAMAPLFYFGKHINDYTGVSYYQARKVTVYMEESTPVRIDGKLASSAEWPLRVSALSNSLTIRIPKQCRNTNALIWPAPADCENKKKSHPSGRNRRKKTPAPSEEETGTESLRQY